MIGTIDFALREWLHNDHKSRFHDTATASATDHEIKEFWANIFKQNVLSKTSILVHVLHWMFFMSCKFELKLLDVEVNAIATRKF